MGDAAGPRHSLDSLVHEMFKDSDHFVQDCRKPHKMALRPPRFKRRPSVTKEQMEDFIERVRTLMAQYPLERVINIDETNWWRVSAGFLTRAMKGAEPVSGIVDSDDNGGVTVIAAMSGGGEITLDRQSKG
jgi:hypothetical protein